MSVNLFDLIHIMFTDAKKYAQIKNSDKGKHYFLVQRFMSIKYPTTAHSLSRVGINPSAVVDLWQMVACRFSRVPGWIYTKTKKQEREKELDVNTDAAKFWMERNSLTERDLKNAYKFNPEEMKKILKAIEKQISVYDR